MFSAGESGGSPSTTSFMAPSAALTNRVRVSPPKHSSLATQL